MGIFPTASEIGYEVTKQYFEELEYRNFKATLEQEKIKERFGKHLIRLSVYFEKYQSEEFTFILEDSPLYGKEDDIKKVIISLAKEYSLLQGFKPIALDLNIDFNSIEWDVFYNYDSTPFSLIIAPKDVDHFTPLTELDIKNYYVMDCKTYYDRKYNMWECGRWD